MVYAYALRFDFHVPADMRRGLWTWLCVVVILRPLTLVLMDGYNATWRFFDLRDSVSLILRSLPLTVVLLLVRTFLPNLPIIPYSVLILEFGLFLTFAGILRVTRRLTHELVHAPTQRARALVVGNEATLAATVHHVRSCREAHIIGLLSEDERLIGIHILGVPVLGLPTSLSSILMTYQIELVILSGANLECAAQVIQDATDFDIQVRILPSVGDFLQGRVQVSRVVGINQIAHTRTEMNGEPHPVVKECFGAQTVLVTGAGGSIGSEIARQLTDLNVRRLVVLDHDENSIFELMNQLEAKKVSREIIPVVGNIRDRDLMRLVFDRYRPEIALHAAAYKHVPVMEENCCEAVLNNICGTRQLVDTAIRNCCERVVMISTDKAVRPSSVMGATKRVAEMLIQQRAIEAAWRGLKTHFACVRFGNVLGSRGSVMPIFLRQIAAGGPITITHAEMTRYFMTIPQAVQLVLQAATLAFSGDIFMLDMGDPVRIIDFAKQIVRLAGLAPGKDIEIKVVGMRPGEKLHEQLWREDAQVTDTEFAHVFQVRAIAAPANFSYLLDELERTARAHESNEAIQTLLHKLPIDYRTEHEKVETVAAVS
jgi:FlaA1/EpsC-like NDP-sugar epimerase